MKYLEAAILLRNLITETNSHFIKNSDEIINNPNMMRIILEKNNTKDINMETFSNEYLTSTLENLGQTQAFVFTDTAMMEVKGKDITYLLYKAYHSKIDKGLVFYQLIDKTLSPQGSLQFSNLEKNIFYKIQNPDIEESSCNAMETDKVVKDGKSIVFFIGHMDEERLLYDIERLIFDTIHNVMRHSKLQFNFIIHISRYGNDPSEDLKKRVKQIENYTREYIYPIYTNAVFEFTFEQ